MLVGFGRSQPLYKEKQACDSRKAAWRCPCIMCFSQFIRDQ